MASRTLELPRTLVEAPSRGAMSAGLAVRLAASAIDLVILFVDVIVAFLHRDRRALHDMIADTIVVEVR